ncbi:chemotaxis protein CheW [Rhodoblastus acidophilus]|uniref:Chemotaxis protein CheW n=1 Tax=Candidatus Rhodoblastus alkanivorans TaxID=2954117 RepID=A0ABS9Z412_9HYPH|nr:chemotaxis protein CheW [Candidatus Rhodoblastus alkanivorans]MCI4678817.1 chemotaxis protein CheW [Candidatus Rhodoblastus alkanivorans]MCI4682206.1 chemotaxis protein CheW [Candidatus Rhodoblastus alkanivorans]MDI4639508.1 chemotaxis protein CheW [Rhodoblastus acidophilus]
MSFEPSRTLSETPQAAANALDGYFSIKVADDVFGLSVTRVQTIFRIGSVTRAPGGPRDIVGLVNLRGKIVTAVSLRRRLGLRPEDGGAGSLAIGIEHGGEAFALLVDEIGDVLSLAPDTAIAPPPHIARGRAKFAAAYHRIAGRIMPLLNIDAVFDFSEDS